MKRSILILAAVLVAAFLLFFICKRKKPNVVVAGETEKKNGKIYGVNTCKYTILQKQKYPEYDYIDCNANPDYPRDIVSAYPTTIHGDGSVIVGYN